MIKTVEAPEYMKVELMAWLDKGFDGCKNNLTLKWENGERREKYDNLITCGNEILNQFEDTKVVCALTYSNEDGMRSVALTKTIAKQWDVSEDQIIEQCKANIEDEIFHLRPMNEVLSDMMNCDMDQFVPNDNMMYVLTNKTGLNGSRVLLSDYTQRFLKEKFEKFFIIPSSVHELLVVTDNGTMTQEDLECLVKEVNDTQVEERDRLSYKVAHVA